MSYDKDYYNAAQFMNELTNSNNFIPGSELFIAVISLLEQFQESTKIIVKRRHSLDEDAKKHSWKSISEYLNKHFDCDHFTISRCEKKYHNFRKTFFKALKLYEISDIATEIMKLAQEKT